MKDLGLTYTQAAHGVQSTLQSEILQGPVKRIHPKHMRVGIDMSKADMAGLAKLLMDKGVFTMEEYLEAIRLSANDELARDQERLGANFR